MSGSGIPVLVVFGATASGKTAFAGSFFSSGPCSDVGVDVFSGFRGRAEVISADSMQVYRGMDIGTAKPDRPFLATLPHHLIDIRYPNEQFCAGDFVRLADEACRDIYSRGKLPVILGGTAFYIRNFLFGLPITPESDPEIRQRTLERLKTEGAPALMEELRAVDPISAARINLHDEYRIARALEVYASSGRPLSSFALPTEFRAGYRPLLMSLDRPREELNRRIDARVDAMFDQGLAEEVSRLRAAGFGPDDPGMQAIGYREFFATSATESSATEPSIAESSIALEAIRSAIKNDSRKYAKRQETFIRAIPAVRHFFAEDFVGIGAALADFAAEVGFSDESAT